MILKGANRGGAKQLALHLLSDENDHIIVHEVSGFMADDVEGALQEIYAISKGTKCSKYLFSLSLSPPKDTDISDYDFDEAIAQVEDKLGLKGQSKVVVIHEKGNRSRHAHCVWSRIDTDNMKAIELGLYKKQLNIIAKDLYIQHGWDMPKGFLGHAHSDPRNFTLKEWKQAERQGLNPKQIKASIQQCWQHSDNKKSFTSALTQSGFFLARGDKKNVHLAVDWHGETYVLRTVLGKHVKVKDIKNKIGDADKLPTVAATKAIIKHAHTEAHTQRKEELARQHKYEAKPLKKRKMDLLKNQRHERQIQLLSHQQRQANEHAERQTHYRRGFKGLWDWVSGKSRELKREHQARQLTADTRDKDEKEALIKAQFAERQALLTQMDILQKRQQREVMTLNADCVTHLKEERLMAKFNPSVTTTCNKPTVQHLPEIH